MQLHMPLIHMGIVNDYLSMFDHQLLEPYPTRIIGRLECGRKQLNLSEELGITQSVISRLWQRFQDDGNLPVRQFQGRPVYRRLGHIGLYARRPVRCVQLTATHCRLRLNWSREHVSWTPQLWSCFMFSDDSRFSLQSDSRRTLIWRAPVLGSRTDLHVQSVTMTGHIYLDVILEQHVRLFWGAMGAEFLFMDDNARPHRANIVDESLQ
ncbi:transposable element Tcb1 transposase [Trichonephila clavipes]|nr:transposable element Tcb1 transposase [Trichonephila clavipes]